VPSKLGEFTSISTQKMLDELQDMVGSEGEWFANRVLHFASSLRGTSQSCMVQAEE
jgi:hypothetical protein